MTEAINRLIKRVSKNELVTLLAESSYPYAVWRSSQAGEKHLIVSLSGVPQKSLSLEGSDPGFVMNPFESQHPSFPFFIAADLTFTKKDVRINPRINAQKVDEFKSVVDELKRIPEKSRENIELAKNKKGDDFEMSVELAVEEIKKGTFEKVVLSDFQEIPLPPGHLDLGQLFDTLCEVYPNAFCSMVNIPGHGLWVGASPETLLTSDKDHFKTISLAATKWLSEDQELSTVAWTQKEIEEQALVSRYIINCFKKIRLREFQEYGPKTVKAGNLAHLKTEYTVCLDRVEFPGLADQMLELLHPTAAVCGMPLEPAHSFIRKIEGYDREFYSGFLGSVGFEGSAELFVNLRCAKIMKGKVRLFGGAGITEDSVPEKEFQEIRMKMKEMESLLIN